MTLDYRTSSLALAACFFLFAGGLFFFQVREVRKGGVTEWIVGQFLIGCYSLFMGLRGSVPDFLSIMVANCCLTASYSVCQVAVQKFLHRPYRRDLLLLPTIVTILFYLLFWAYADDIYLRSLYICLLSGLQSGIIAALLLGDALPRMRRSQWFTGFIFAVITLLWGCRFIELLAFPTPPSPLLEMNLFWTAALLGGIGLVILINIGALLMIRERSEEHLRESEERYRRLFEDSVIGISELSPDGRLMRANSAYIRMYGYEEQEEEMPVELHLSGRQPYANPADEEEVMGILAQRGNLEPREIRMTRRDGAPLIIVMTAREMRASDGRLLSIQMTHMDVTDRRRVEEERKQLQERLQRAEKMEALGILAGGVAHDLNNVLGVLVGYSELMLNAIDSESPFREDIENILSSGERAGAIVQDLLTLARRNVHLTKVIDLNAIIRDYLATPEYAKLALDHRNIRITTEHDADLPRIKGSPLHLGKTLMNLVANAAESITGAGEIRIRTESRYLEKPVTGYEDIKIGDYVVLSVSDTGAGISPADMSRIFEPFYTKKTIGRSGTGLGLSVVWGTVKDHCGYIDVTSEEGKGSTFTLFFPVTGEEASEETVVPLGEYMGRGESILVVDDVKEQRELAGRMLGMLNYRVTSVSSGEEAVNHLAVKPYDLIVLDMIMNPGMDGLDTYKKIIRIHSRQKAIIVSGYAESERVLEAQSLGAGAYVRKPYVRERLGMAVRRELDRQGSSPLA